MNSEIDSLQNKFLSGSSSPMPDGFYHGKLLHLIPEYTVEHLGAFISQLWMPWKGKWFQSAAHRGDNIIEPTAKRLFELRNPKEPFGEMEYGGYHSFSFSMNQKPSIVDPREVIALDYDVHSNTDVVRQVIDEIVCIGEGDYIGKAYLKEDFDYRLVAFFELKK
jgi:hypothetical protein